MLGLRERRAHERSRGARLVPGPARPRRRSRRLQAGRAGAARAAGRSSPPGPGSARRRSRGSGGRDGGARRARGVTPTSRRGPSSRSRCCAGSWRATAARAGSACCPARGCTTSTASCARRGHGDEPAWLAEELRAGDPAAAISRAALEGRSARLRRGPRPLRVGATAPRRGTSRCARSPRAACSSAAGSRPRILPWLRRPPFLAAFLAKGRLRPLLEDMPVARHPGRPGGARRARPAARGGGP